MKVLTTRRWLGITLLAMRGHKEKESRQRKRKIKPN